MAREFKRTDRLGDQVQRELARLLEFEARDPRLHAVTITAVQVSRDLAHAKVYVTFFGPDEERDAILQALGHASGFLRRELARRLVIRSTPALRFVYDEAVDRGRRLTSLIDTAVHADRAMAEGRHEADETLPPAEPDADADPGGADIPPSRE